MVAVMDETTNQTKEIILSIVVKVFGSLFQGIRIFILKSLNHWVIKQKKKMTTS